MRFGVLIVLVLMFVSFSEGVSVLAYWSLNGSEPGLTLHGGPTFVEGRYPGSKAINFNQPSNCFARIPKVELRGRSFTIALWVKVKSILNRNQAVFSDWYHPWQFFINVDHTGAIHFVRHSSDAYWYAANMKSTSKIDAGRWYHIAVTWDQSGGVSKLYIDAKETNSIAIDKSKVWLGATRDTYEIGDDGHWLQHQFLGSVMDLYIIHGVLDSDEISRLKGCHLPSEPIGIGVYDFQSRSLMFKWKRPTQDCNSTQLTYTVYYKVVGEQVLHKVDVLATKVRLHSLKPNTRYEMFVTAKNEYGYGPRSLKITAWTLQEVCHLPSEPINLTAYDIQSRSLMLSWKRPTQDCKSTQLTYTVHYKVQGEQRSHQVDMLATKMRLHSLKPNTRYEMFVTAKNEDGYGPRSLKITASTLQEGCHLPSEPINLTAYDIQSRSLMLSWEMPTRDCNSTQLTYTVYYKVRGEHLHDVEVLATKVKLISLKPNKRYEMFVTANNEDGHIGPRSLTITASTLQEVKKEATSCVSDWVKMNGYRVCFGGVNFGSLHNNIRSGIVVAVKLEHVYGRTFPCTDRTHQRYWGCSNPDGKKNHLNVVITDQFNNIIFPKKQYTGAVWYQMPFVDVASSRELVFTDFANPFFFPKNKEMRIWFGEDLKGKRKDHNAGYSCVDVYAKFMG